MPEDETSLEKVVRLTRVVVPRHRRRDPRTGKVEDVETYTYQRRGSVGGGLRAKTAIAGRFNVPKDRDVVGERHAAELEKRQTPQIVGKSKVPKIGSGMTEKQQQYQRNQRLRPSSGAGTGPAAKGGPNYAARRDAARARPTAAPPGSQRAKVERLGQARQKVSSLGRSIARARTKQMQVSKAKPPVFHDAPVGPKKTPTKLMTPESHKAHVNKVLALINEHQAKGNTTDKLHTHPVINPATGKQRVDADGHPVVEYNLDREKLHQKILDKLMAKAVARGLKTHPPGQRKAVMSGGLGGAGKSTVLYDPRSGVDPNQYITLNPDDIKEEMLKLGMQPPGVEGLQPFEMAPLIHEESSYITKQLADRAQADGYDVMWDIVMSSDNQVKQRMDQLDANGYTTQAVFVSIPAELSAQRALGRHNEGASKLLLEGSKNGENLGGRFVDPRHILKSKSTDPNYRSWNEKTFDNQKKRFNDWQMWDTSGSLGESFGTDPVLVDTKKDGKSPMIDPATRGLPVGTIRVWAGGRYQKLPDGNWKLLKSTNPLVNTSRAETSLDKVIRLTASRT